MKEEKAQQIGYALRNINNQIRRNLDARFAINGLDELCGMQGPILGYIEEKSRKGDVFQKDIEKKFNIRRSTATTTLQNMEQKGFLIREAVEGDGRLKRILLTEKAKNLNKKVRLQIDSFHKMMEEGLSEEEKIQFLCTLEKIQQNLISDRNRKEGYYND